MVDDDAAPMAEEPEPIWMGLQEREQEAASANDSINASRRASLTKEDSPPPGQQKRPVPKLEKADSALYFDAAALIMKTAQSSDSVRLPDEKKEPSPPQRQSPTRQPPSPQKPSPQQQLAPSGPPGRLDAKTAAVAAVNIQANARGMMARRDYHQTQKAVRSIEAHARGAHARHGLHEAQTAAKSIEAHARGFRCRREYNKQVKCARSIQARIRGNQLRRRALGFARGEEDPLHVNAVVLVRKMLEMPEDAARAPKIASNYLTTDFIDVIDLGPGSRNRTNGVKAYLQDAQGRSPLKIVDVLVYPWVTRSAVVGSSTETTVEREVMITGERHLRIEYTVRHGKFVHDDRICQRRTMIIDEEGNESHAFHEEVGGTSAAGAAASSSSPFPGRQKKNALRDSFAKLDADGSGHLSIDEIIRAANLVNVRFDKPDLEKQLLAGDSDGDGTFELHELDSILRKDRILQNTGMERSLSRPLVFEVLPLVARSFDAHFAVEDCLAKAAEREKEIVAEQRRERARATRELTESPDIVAVKRAHACAVSSRKNRSKKAREQRRSEDELPPDLRGAKQALAGQTEELAQILESFEERLAAAEKKEEVSVAELASFESMAKSLEDACATANKQRNKLDGTIQGRVLSNSKAPPRHHELPRSSSKSAFEKPRRPHGLPPMPQSSSQPLLPSRAHRVAHRAAITPEKRY